MREFQKNITRSITSKRASIEMSFQFIFSIFLIAVFIVAAGIVINMFLKTGEHTKIATAYSTLETEINNMLLEPKAEKTLTLNMPARVEMICFSDKLKNVDTADLTGDELKAYNELEKYKDEDANFYFYPIKGVSYFKISPLKKITCGKDKIECLDLSNLPNNFYCAKNDKGSIKITLVKKYGEQDVEIKP